MKLEFKKSFSDVRGIILFCSYGKSSLHFVKTKKGFSRGGHYHKFKSDHILLKGKIEFKEFNISTNFEQVRILSAPITITVEPNIAHLLTALEDTVFLEFFHSEYSSTDYIPYRTIVEKKIK